MTRPEPRKCEVSRRATSSIWPVLAGILTVSAWGVSACRDSSTSIAPDAAVEEKGTRFDEMEDDTSPRRVSKVARENAITRIRHVIDTALDRAVTVAAATFLTEEPLTMEAAAARGSIVGIVQRKRRQITLRLDGDDGLIFTEFEEPRLETSHCWTTIWQPQWLPVASAGPGVALNGKAELVWWRFEDGDKPPYLVRFDPDGVAIWRPDSKEACYRGESLLGLAGGGLRTVDYLSPVVPTDGASPDETEETQGSKPLRIDILKPRGKEILTARDGVVELRSAKKKRIQRWTTTLPRGSAACTQAAYHRFEGEPVRLFFEIEFTDDEACDEGWGRREVQQTLFEMRGTELVPIVSGGTSATGNDEGEMSTTVKLDVRIPTGAGWLRYVGSGVSKQSEVGGDDGYDCSTWASDLGLDAADTGFSFEDHTGVWTFDTDESVLDVGPVSAVVRSYQCSEAQ